MPKFLDEAIPGVLGVIFYTLLDASSYAVRNYSPQSILAAKIVNEQIKLTATTVNSVALALAGIAVVVPIVTQLKTPLGDAGSAIALVFAFLFHVSARRILGGLKSESISEVQVEIVNSTAKRNQEGGQ